jgi:hypothetical protein
VRLVLAALFTESPAGFRNINHDYGRAIRTKRKPDILSLPAFLYQSTPKWHHCPQI